MNLRSSLQALPERFWSNETVCLRPIKTEADLIFAANECQLTKEQREFVNPVWFSVGRAYLEPEKHWPCVICTTEGERIGFLDFYCWNGGEEATSWSFFIDLKQQGKGYGRAAAALAGKLLKAGVESRQQKHGQQKQQNPSVQHLKQESPGNLRDRAVGQLGLNIGQVDR